MLYTVKELLAKLGTPELNEKRQLAWRYFAADRPSLAGQAEIRFSADGSYLVADIVHVQENVTDDDGHFHALKTESFYLYAEQTARPDVYRVTKIAFDGEDYSQPSKAICELGFSIFHARALDISIRMIEQTFNKNDMLEPRTDDTVVRDANQRSGDWARQEKQLRQAERGVVIPFPGQTRPARAAVL